MSLSAQQTAIRQAGSTTHSLSLLQTGAALIFGAVILFAVGFVPISSAHNAAHDTRHSFAFPCH